MKINLVDFVSMCVKHVKNWYDLEYGILQFYPAIFD